MAADGQTRKLKRASLILGRVYLAVTFCVIAFGFGAIWWFRGFEALQDVMSPFNFVGWGVVIATLAPGLLLVHYGER